MRIQLAAILLAAFGMQSQVPKLIPFRKGTSWGYANTKKEFVIPLQFQTAEPFANGSAIAKLNGKFCLIDESGKSLIECDSIIRVREYPNLLVLQNGKWGLANPKGSWVFEPKYPGVYTSHEPKPFVHIYGQSGHNTGWLDMRSGSQYLSTEFECREPRQGYAPVTKNDKYGLADSTGRLIIPIKFDEVSPFGEGLFLASMYNGEEDAKHGLFNASGKQILPVEYSQVSYFKNGLSRVCKGELCGFIDKTGNFVVPLKYRYLSEFNEGIASYYEDAKEPYVFMNTRQEVLFRKDASTIGAFSNGMCMFGRNMNASTVYGYMNTKGEEVIPVQFDVAHPFSEERALVQRGSALLIIDKTGKPVNDEIYYSTVQYVNSKEVPPYFVAGKVRLMKMIPGARQFMGMVGRNGEVLAPFKYDEIESTGRQFRTMLRVPNEQNLYGYIDSASGKPIADVKYNSTYGFVEGMAMVWRVEQMKGYCGFIDTTGKETVELKYQQGHNFSEGLAAVQLNDKWGFVDKKGTVVIEPKYDRLERAILHSGFSNGLIKVYRGTSQGFIDRQGNEYFED